MGENVENNWQELKDTNHQRLLLSNQRPKVILSKLDAKYTFCIKSYIYIDSESFSSPYNYEQRY